MNYFRVGRWQPASGVKLGVRVMDRRIRGHLSIETGKITAFFRLVEAMCNTHTVLVCGSTYVLLFVRSLLHFAIHRHEISTADSRFVLFHLVSMINVDHFYVQQL